MKLLLMISIFVLSLRATAEVILSEDACKFPMNIKIEEFREALSLKEDPKPMVAEALKSGLITEAQRKALLSIQTVFYEFKEIGISVFFGAESKYSSTTFKSPYRGSVKGVKVGDSLENLIKTIGKPSSVKLNRYYYSQPSDKTHASYEIKNDYIVAIYTNGCGE